MMMVRAGSPVDELMDQLFRCFHRETFLLMAVISNYEDTNRRVQLAESKGFLFVGSGVSGGEEEPLNGASIMPSGSEKSMVGSETDSSKYCGKSAGRHSLLSMGGSCRLRSFCEDDSQRYRIW